MPRRPSRARAVTEVTSDLALAAVREDEFPALARVRVSALRDSLERIGSFDEAQVIATFREQFSARDTQHIVRHGERIGLVAMRPSPSGYLLDHLYLLPGHQGQGSGGAVLRHKMAAARAAGAPLWVGVLRSSAANRFYVAHGFRWVSEDRCDIYYVYAPTLVRARARRARGAEHG